MSNDRKNTIVLLQYGREVYTDRWLQHIQSTDLDCPIIVADGLSNGLTQSLLAKNHVNARYFSIEQNSWADLYKRIIVAIERTDTEYVQFSANDDFLLPSGIRASISFLDGHADFVSGGAGTLGFYLLSHKPLIDFPVSGDMFYGLGPAYRNVLVDSDDAATRVRSFAKNYAPVFYAVHRRETLLRAWKQVEGFSIADPRVAETMAGYMIASEGKIHYPNGPFFSLRQRNSWDGPKQRNPFETDIISEQSRLAKWATETFGFVDKTEVLALLQPKSKPNGVAKRLAFSAYLKSGAVRHLIDTRDFRRTLSSVDGKSSIVLRNEIDTIRTSLIRDSR